jgi:hypothetical protein|eukprot:COSAG01_NODE_10517_length_2145_cov_2.138807_3_plen_96_part_00
MRRRCGGNGTHAGSDGASCTRVEAIWEYFDQIYMYLYADSGGSPRVRYGTEANSTVAHLRTATKLALPAVGFWTLDTADEAMVDALLAWAADGTS